MYVSCAVKLVQGLPDREHKIWVQKPFQETVNCQILLLNTVLFWLTLVTASMMPLSYMNMCEGVSLKFISDAHSHSMRQVIQKMDLFATTAVFCLLSYITHSHTLYFTETFYIKVSLHLKKQTKEPTIKYESSLLAEQTILSDKTFASSPQTVVQTLPLRA